MINSEEGSRGPAVYNLNRVHEDRKNVGSRKPPSHYIVNRSQNPSKSFNGGNLTSDYGSQANGTKRLLSKTGARRGVRGELLTNGYKSLRA